MYHLFSSDPIVDLFTNIKCLQANPFAVCFAAYCSRQATRDTEEKRPEEEADKRLCGTVSVGVFETVAFYS